MKSIKLFLSLLCVLSFLIIGGCSDDEDDDAEFIATLLGQPGNPRFNLSFEGADADLDLHVIDPSGERIYFANKFSNSGGQLDVDCICCEEGIENIFWQDGEAPSGEYRFWVDRYGGCFGSSSSSADFTVRVIRNNRIVATYTGSLSSGESDTWTHVQ